MLKYQLLREFLEQQGYKQKFVADKIGIRGSTLSGILNGKRKCSLEIYAEICRFLGVPFEMFIDDQPQKSA